jgi:hypothetical protein
MKIKINKKQYSVKFGVGSTRLIVEHYGYTKPSDYEKLVKKFNLENLEDPTFAQLGFMAMLFKAAVLNAGHEDDFTTDDVLDSITANPELMSGLIAEFEKSQTPAVANPAKRGK